MKRLKIVPLVILLSLSNLVGQSNRVRSYSESAPETGSRQIRKKPFPDRQPENKEPEKPTADVIRIETDLVIIPARISDGQGKVVSDLKKEEFKIFENGVEQELAFFSDEDQPFTVALILDMSYSSVFKLRDIQEAAFAFINQLRPDDKVMIVSFDEKVQVLCEPTNNRRALRMAIEATRISSGSGVYAALNTVLDEKLNAVAGRKAIVMLSDGVDTTGNSSQAEKILESLGESDVLVFPIQYDTYGDVQKSRKQNAQIFYDDDDRPYTIELPRMKGERAEDYKTADEFLKGISHLSGGRVYPVSTSTNLNQAFASIAEELRKIYSLGYYPSGNTNAGELLTIRVRVYRPNLNIRAKSSYLRKRRRN